MMESTIKSTTNTVTSDGDTKRKKISFKFTYNNLMRKRYLYLDTLTLEGVRNEVTKLFYLPNDNFKLYLSPRFKGELRLSYIRMLIEDEMDYSPVKIYIKEGSLTTKKNSLQGHIVEQMMNQVLVKRFLKKEFSKCDLEKI